MMWVTAHATLCTFIMTHFTSLLSDASTEHTDVEAQAGAGLRVWCGHHNLNWMKRKTCIKENLVWGVFGQSAAPLNTSNTIIQKPAK